MKTPSKNPYFLSQKMIFWKYHFLKNIFLHAEKYLLLGFFSEIKYVSLVTPATI